MAARARQSDKTAESRTFAAGAAGPDRLGDAAYARLRDMIMRGQLSRPNLVREAELVREFGISRTPVREALRRLEAEGLIEAVPNGYLVVELDDEALADVYRVRAVLEALAARLACENRTQEALGRLADIVDAMDAHLKSSNEAQLTRLNREFHLAVAAAASNQYLYRLLSDVGEVFDRYRLRALSQPGRMHSAHQEHRTLLDLITGREAERAANLASQHALTGLASLMSGRHNTESKK